MSNPVQTLNLIEYLLFKKSLKHDSTLQSNPYYVISGPNLPVHLAIGLINQIPVRPHHVHHVDLNVKLW